MMNTEQWSEYHIKAPSNSLISRYLEKTAHEDHYAFDAESCVIVKDFSVDETACITVITRTQGRRLEELKEVLLCLNGQTSRNFEVCVMAHNTTDEQLSNVLRIINSQVPWLRDRIRLVRCTKGGRAKPLNDAFHIARTDYVSILDDDDVVFDNWISAFERLAADSFGSILFSYAFTQKWCAIEAKNGSRTLRATEAPVADYTKDFDPVSQLSLNRCPTMSLAFPTFSFKELGIHFNDELSTTEDWDFLMRTSFVCGVANTGEPSSIYRLWENAESSYQLHDKSEWNDNYNKIRNRFAEMPVLFPEGCSVQMSESLRGFGGIARPKKGDIFLYAETPKGIDWENPIDPNVITVDGRMDSTMFNASDLPENCGRIAISFFRGGLVTLRDISVEVTFANGNTKVFGMYDLESNGVSAHDGEVAFLSRNPCIIAHVPKQKMASIKISFRATSTVEEGLLTGTKIAVRLDEKIRRIKHRAGIKFGAR